MNVKCLRKAYQRATIQSVQIDGEIKSMTEDQGLKNLMEATIKSRPPSSYEWRLAIGWHNISQRQGVGGLWYSSHSRLCSSCKRRRRPRVFTQLPQAQRAFNGALDLTPLAFKAACSQRRKRNLWLYSNRVF